MTRSTPGLETTRPADNCPQLNRPKSLNAFGGRLLLDLISALRELNEHPDTVFTVLTGEGRFFSSGADVKGMQGFFSVNSTMLRIAESTSSRLARTRPIKAQLLIAPPLVASVSQQAIEYATPAEKKIAFIANVGASGKHVKVTA